MDFYVEVHTVQKEMQTMQSAYLSVNYKNCQTCWSLWFANKGIQKIMLMNKRFNASFDMLSAV
jgi:hypothetical protein